MPQPREPRDFTTPPKSVAALLFASALVLAPSGPVHAVTFDFTRIVQSSDALGGARTFDQSTGAFVSDGNVLFNNIRTSDGRQEFHVSLGGALHFVADDTTTPVPDQIGNFSALLQLDIDGETVAFSANTPSTPTGIYSWTTTDGLQTVVDNTITPPGAAGGFNNATLGGFEDGVVTFLGGSGGNGTANSGIFTRRLSDGVVETVADLSDFPLGFGLVRSGGGDSLFVVTGPELYTNDGGTFRLVADTNTPIPGGTGNFTAVDVGTGYATDGETIAFQGSGSGQIGIYKDVAGTLSVVVDNTTVVPDGTGGVFASFNQRVPDVGNGAIVFSGTESGGKAGVYTDLGGILQSVISPGDLLDGRIVDAAAFQLGGFDGRDIAITVNFTNGDRGVYLASANLVPEPNLLALLAIGLVGAGFSGRGRRRLHA